MGSRKVCPVDCRQKNAKKSISWSARAASRWILDKLKEDGGSKVLRVQASDETLEGLGSKDLVGGLIRDHLLFIEQGTYESSFLSSNRTGIQRTMSRSWTAVDISDRRPEIPSFFSVATSISPSGVKAMVGGCDQQSVFRF